MRPSLPRDADPAPDTGRRPVLAVAVALAALALLWMATATPQWAQLDAGAFDLFTALSAPGAQGTPIVIVAIDEPSLAELKLRWPFPRRVHAALIDQLRQSGAKVIGFDVLFAEPSPDGEDDALLAAAIARAGNVVLAGSREVIETSRSTQWLNVEALPALRAAGAASGDVGVDPAADFVVRHAPTGADSFANVIAGRFAGAATGTADMSAPTYIRYAGPHGTFPTVHYYQAVTPGLLPRDYFRGKIVLVGLAVASSPEIQRRQADLYNSPFFRSRNRLLPGVEIHANLIENRLQGHGLRAAPAPASLALAAVFLALVWWVGRRWHPLYATLAVMTGAALVFAACFALFAAADIWLSPVAPMVAGAMLYIAQTIAGFLAQRRRALETRRAFAQYVPPEVVSRLVKHPELLALGGETRELTLLFCDLADFTTISERIEPAQVVALLTDYFSTMSTVIHRFDGTVDKYIGDGIMAFWGAPLPDSAHAQHGVEAAIAMRAAFAGLAQRWNRPGLPPLALRIGIHTGVVIVGNVGSSSRFAYTAIGDAVNIAARLEGENKKYGTTVLMSGDTARALPASMRTRAVDTVVVKGKSVPVEVFTPLFDEPASGDVVSPASVRPHAVANIQVDKRS